MAVIENINQLLELNDDAFVEAVYQTLLRRPADPEGLYYYMNVLRAGNEKEAVIDQIYYSDEARSINASLIGLDRLIHERHMGRHPIFGIYWRWRQERRRRQQQLNRLEYQLGFLSRHIKSRIDELGSECKAGFGQVGRDIENTQSASRELSKNLSKLIDESVRKNLNKQNQVSQSIPAPSSNITSKQTPMKPVDLREFYDLEAVSRIKELIVSGRPRA